jgi:hypothetical protein
MLMTRIRMFGMRGVADLHAVHLIENSAEDAILDTAAATRVQRPLAHDGVNLIL